MSFNIEFDYRFAPVGAFDDNAKQRLEEAARIWESYITDEFPNIPIGTQFSVINPQTDEFVAMVLDREIDDLLIFVDGKPIVGSVDGYASRGFVAGTPPDSFMPYVGSITLDGLTA